MKKNLLSVLILALLIVNIVLNVIMMVNVLSTNGKTADLVTSIATVLNLEYTGPGGGSANSVPLSQTATYDFTKVMIQLKHYKDADGRDAGADMIIFDMSLAMDTKHDDYKTYGEAETMAQYEIQIKDAVESVVNQYSQADFENNYDQIKAEILTAIQRLFQSDFIYNIYISGVMYN